MSQPLEVWCVRHEDGWCATDNRKWFKDGQDSVKTACGKVVALPWGCLRTVPTCPECRGRRALR